MLLQKWLPVLFACCFLGILFLAYWISHRNTEFVSTSDDQRLCRPLSITKRINAAVVILVDHRPARVQSLCLGLQALHKHLTAQFPYPVLLFHDETLRSKHKHFLSNCSMTETQFIKIDMARKLFTDEDIVTPLINCSTCSWGYLKMIQFFFVDIFLHPAVRDLDYFMRLDTDSAILSPIQYNPFEYMYRNRKHYGFRQRGLTPRLVSQKMWPYVNSFLRKQKILPAQPWSFSKSNPRVPYFYNNFEVVDVKRFQQIDVFSFLHRVALSKNIHRYRWGDAPLRWLTVHIFFHQNETQFFCDFDYRHKNIVWEAVPGGNANCQLEESSPGKEIPYTKWEQHQELLANKQLQ